MLLFFIFNLRGFGSAIPDDVKSRLKEENLIFMEEGVPVTVLLRNFRAPGRYSSHSITRGKGSLAISDERIVGYGGRRQCVIDVPFGHQKIAALGLSTKREKVLCISFEASEFDPQQSGDVELRFHLAKTPEAMSILQRLT